MTLNCCKFKFSRNFALVGMFGRQQRLNEWRQTRIVCEGIVAHGKYFSKLYRLRWYCWAILSRGRFSELCPIYQGCRALTFALARLSCKTRSWISYLLEFGGVLSKNDNLVLRNAFWDSQLQMFVPSHLDEITNVGDVLLSNVTDLSTDSLDFFIFIIKQPSK